MVPPDIQGRSRDHMCKFDFFLSHIIIPCTMLKVSVFHIEIL